MLLQYRVHLPVRRFQERLKLVGRLPLRRRHQEFPVAHRDVRQRIAGTEARLVERHKDVRVMEAYIDHLKEAAFKEELDAEQIELDDVATMQYARVKREGA